LPEKIEHYNRHTQEALDIISNAHKHVAQFFDHKREKLISLLVLKSISSFLDRCNTKSRLKFRTTQSEIRNQSGLSRRLKGTKIKEAW